MREIVTESGYVNEIKPKPTTSSTNRMSLRSKLNKKIDASIRQMSFDEWKTKQGIWTPEIRADRSVTKNGHTDKIGATGLRFNKMKRVQSPMQRTKRSISNRPFTSTSQL